MEHEQQLLDTLAREAQRPIDSLSVSLSALASDLDTLSHDEAVGLLRKIQQNVGWLYALVENLTTSARLAGEKLRLRSEPVPLGECIDDALAIAYPWLGWKSGLLVIEGVTDGLTVRGDRRALTQIFLNLLINLIHPSLVNSSPINPIPIDAIPIASDLARTDRITPRQPARIRVFPEGRWVRVVASEMAPGMLAAGDLAGSGTPSVEGVPDPRDPGGTGLGMYLIKVLVERQGGTLGLERGAGAAPALWFVLPATKLPPRGDGRIVYQLRDRRRAPRDPDPTGVSPPA